MRISDWSSDVCSSDLTGDALPVVAPDTPMAEAVVVMSEKSFGVAVVAEDGIIKGVISDGDMRRNVSRLWHSTASDIATPLPVLIRKDWLAADAVGLMTSEGITAALVEDDEGRLIGLLHIHDCLRVA